MNIPKIGTMANERYSVSAFKGLDRHRRIADGAFAECMNMASEEYPVAVVREPRRTIGRVNTETGNEFEAVLPGLISGAVSTDGSIALLSEDNTVVYSGRHWHIDSGFAQQNHLVGFGRGLFVSPSCMYIPDKDNDACYTARCSASGSFDITADETTGMMMTRITPASGETVSLDGFRSGDAVDITNFGSVSVQEVGTSDAPYLIVDTMADEATGVQLTIERRAPVLDHICVHDNRVWGCRYGLNDKGEFVNEIYACRLGDPLNWFSYKGLIEDSFAISVGEPGKWTGCAVCDDRVIFFKEHCMITVYGDMPSNYYTQLTYCDGVMDGSHRSITTINGSLYYKSTVGICRLEAGSLPVVISEDLGVKDIWQGAFGEFGAVAGTDGRKLYIQMLKNHDTRGWEMYVYDTHLAEWHRESAVDDMRVCVKHGNACVFITSSYDRDRNVSTYLPIYVSSGVTEEHMYPEMPQPSAWMTDHISYPGDDDYPGSDVILRMVKKETDIEWSFETGDFGYDAAEYKRVKSIEVRAELPEEDGRCLIEIQYDRDGKWVSLEPVYYKPGEGLHRIRYLLRRCDLFRLRLSGINKAVIHSIVIEYEYAGDRQYEN